MNIQGFTPIDPYMASNVEPFGWVKIWNELPKQGSIVPIWDGEYLYYAVYWNKDDKQLWIVTDQIGLDLNDIHLRKSQGEQVWPMQWMKISAPVE